MRKLILFFFSALTVVSLIGLRWEPIWSFVFGAPSPLWGRVVMDLRWVDKQALALGFFPLGLAVGLIGLTATWFWPQIWAQLSGRARARTQFLSEFNTRSDRETRQFVAWRFERAYKKFIPKGQPLKTLVDRLDFPQWFPPTNIEIGDYPSSLTWVNGESQILWEFVNSLFKCMLEPEKQGFLPPDVYDAFTREVRNVGAFWDNWGRELLCGKLVYDDVKAPLEANLRGVRLIALAELAIASNFSWDQGSGRKYLFQVAAGHRHLNDRKWLRKQCKRLMESVDY